MFYLIGAKAEFKAATDFKINNNICDSEIKLMLDNKDIITVNFCDYGIEGTDKNKQTLDTDNLSNFGFVDTISIEWKNQLNYISNNDFELFDDDAAFYKFENISSIVKLEELSYVVDDILYKGEELLKLTRFSLILEDDNFKKHNIVLV